MELIRPNTTEFMLYSLGSTEDDYILKKNQISPFYHVINNRLIHKHKINRQLFKINRGLNYADECWSYMKNNEIEYVKDKETEKNNIVEGFLILEDQAKNSVSVLNNEIKNLKEQSSEIEQQVKDKLRKCLEKNLLTPPEAILNSLFTSKNTHDILSAFEKEEDFFKYAKEKEKNIYLRNPNDPTKYLAKASAIKTVSPLISKEERAKNIKTNLTNIKSCIGDAETTLTDFIKHNEFEITSEQNDLLARLQDITKEISSLISVNDRRKIAEHRYSKTIEDRSQEVSVAKKSTDDNAPICASLIKKSNVK